MQKFNERLKTLRLEKRLSQKQLAIDIEISESHYQSYEYGKTEPTLGNIIKLARYFNVSADYLLGLSETRERQP